MPGDQIRVECEVASRHLTMVESRLPSRGNGGPERTRLPVARLRYARATGQWSLSWRDRHLRFHLHDRRAPTPHIDILLAEIGLDPAAIFWARDRANRAGSIRDPRLTCGL